jgi:hypothetical protein
LALRASTVTGTESRTAVSGASSGGSKPIVGGVTALIACRSPTRVLGRGLHNYYHSLLNSAAFSLGW